MPHSGHSCVRVLSASPSWKSRVGVSAERQGSLASGTPPLMTKGLLSVHTGQKATQCEAAVVVAPAGVIFTCSRSEMELLGHGAIDTGFLQLWVLQDNDRKAG